MSNVQICANRRNGGEEPISAQHLGKDRTEQSCYQKIHKIYYNNFFLFSFGGTQRQE